MEEDGCKRADSAKATGKEKSTKKRPREMLRIDSLGTNPSWLKYLTIVLHGRKLMLQGR
jgi:hypothetical protein